MRGEPRSKAAAKWISLSPSPCSGRAQIPPRRQGVRQRIQVKCQFVQRQLAEMSVRAEADDEPKILNGRVRALAAV